jgi:transcriptional regulator with XRE-family HTH domain
VPTKQRPADFGTARGRALIVDAGRELRAARRDHDLSMRVVGAAVGLSEAHVSRIERGLVDGVALMDLARLNAVVGLDLTVRSYAGGSPIRDGAQVTLIEDFCSLLHPSIGWSTEVPLPRRGDPRAWDLVMRGADWRGAAEAETGPRDAQALLRRVAIKQRDGEMESVVLLLRSTAQTRRFLQEAGAAVRSAFPIDGAAALERLRRGDAPGGNAMIVLPRLRRDRANDR